MFHLYSNYLGKFKFNSRIKGEGMGNCYGIESHDTIFVFLGRAKLLTITLACWQCESQPIRISLWVGSCWV